MERLDLLALLGAIAQQEGYFREGTIPARCNNPGDLRFAGQDGSVPSKWGEPIPFAQFDCPGRGIAAGLRQLAKHIQSGLTLKELVAKWAPASDGNNPEAYLHFVQSHLPGIEADRPLWDYLALEAPKEQQ